MINYQWSNKFFAIFKSFGVHGDNLLANLSFASTKLVKTKIQNFLQLELD
jgi:hypothetical protein